MNTTFLIPFFLGTFSGFLATLPIGPAKILAVRKFLLVTKGTETQVSNFESSKGILLASIGGLIFAQLLFFLAVHFPFLYSLWVKPHFFSFFFVFVLFIYLYQLKNIQFNIYNTQPVLTNNLTSSDKLATFLETLLFQLINPVVFPNPIFSRLTHVFLFRYSTILPFSLGNFLGLLGGYSTFYFSTFFLLKKLELDAPTIYRLVKIKIHQFFGLVFVIFSFVCLSRTPLPAIKPFQLKTIPHKLASARSWYEQIWPDSVFGYERWKRPLRVIDVNNEKVQANEEIKPFNKMFFSQFFFEGVLKDGKYRLNHNYPQSLSIVSDHINSLINSSSLAVESNEINKNVIQDWIAEKENRQDKINKNIGIKINQIEDGIFLEELVEKKFSSIDENQNKIAKAMDPRLSNEIRGTNLFFNNNSTLFFNKNIFHKGDSLIREQKNLTTDYTKNKLKLFLAENDKEFLRYTKEKVPLLMWTSSVNEPVEINPHFKEENFENSSADSKKVEFIDFKKEQALDTFLKKISSFFSNVGPITQKISDIEKATKKESTKLIDDENNTSRAIISKVMPLWHANFNKKELDQIKGKTETDGIIQRFFPKNNYLADHKNFVSPSMPFFRRNEFPGTITIRRGKAVCWNGFQKKPHAPLFVNELNILKEFFAKRKKMNINQDIPARSFQPASRPVQIFRDLVLFLQAQIRKYVKLPILIVVKNLTRQVFLQPAEWEKDWKSFSQEIYVECDFYGKVGSIGVKLPNILDYKGPKQIKILNPIELRFWTRSQVEFPLDEKIEKWSYLTVWGQETTVPFGKVKKSPSFWQLFIERIKLLLKYKISKNISLPFPQKSRKEDNELDNNKVEFQSESQEFSPSRKILEKTQESKNQLRKIKTNPSPTNFKSRNKTITKSNQIQIVSSFNKKEKINRVRPYTFQNFSLLIQKQWFHFSRFFFKKQKQLFFGMKKVLFHSKNWFLRNSVKLIKSFTKLFSTVSKFLSIFSYRFWDFLNFLFVKLTRVEITTVSTPNAYNLNPANHLSQAYLIHSIWEDRIPNRSDISSLMKVWNQDSILKKTIEERLIQQGIFRNEKPDFLTEDNWKEWLKSFQGFTPPLKLWVLSSPTEWSQAVEKYWKELPSSKLNSVLNKEMGCNSFSFQSDSSAVPYVQNQFLELHVPFFQAAQKQKKLWKFGLLSRSFTGISNEEDVDSFFIWKSNDFEKKTEYLFANSTKREGKEKILSLNYTNLASFPQVIASKVKQNEIQPDLLKEFPLLRREENRLSFDPKLQTLRQRGSFSPRLIKRWKSKKLRQKLEVLAKNVIKKPQSEKLSSYFSIGEKNKKMIAEILESENKLFTSSLENWNTKVLDDELFMYNTVSSILRFLNKNINLVSFPHGILQDQSSDFFSFFSQGKPHSLDIYFALLEDIYLPTHLREIRILDCLDFQNDFENPLNKGRSSKWNKNEKKEDGKSKTSIYTNSIDEWRAMLKQNKNLPVMTLWPIKDRQTIIRFLWPTHRLEDLSCINRFWTGSANQSRFSMLRIQAYPIL